MKRLKNRKTAITITVIAAVLATLFGVHRSLNAEAARIENMFYDGVYLKEEKYTEPSIDSHLKNRAQSAMLLTSIAGYYGGLDDLTNDVLSARDLLMNQPRISEKSGANEQLQAAFNRLYSALLPVADERDRELMGQYAALFNGAQTAIDESRYNFEVNGFIYGMSEEFPTGILKPFVFVQNPEKF